MKIFTFLICTCLFFTSCKNLLRKNIDYLTVDVDIKEIKSKYTELDSSKIKVLDELIALTRGKDYYVREIIMKDDPETTLIEYLVEEDKFKSNCDNLFAFFKANNVTYEKLLSEVDSINSIKEKYDLSLNNVLISIDKLCIEKQLEFEKRTLKSNEIKKELAEIVRLELISIDETEYDYRDAIMVKIKLVNKTNKRVDAVGFNMEFTDKLGKKLTTIYCKSNDGFDKSHIGSWVYEKYDRIDVYNALRNVKASHVKVKYEITDLNYEGKITSADKETLSSPLDMNYNYKTPKKLDGYCPYINDENELIKKVNSSKDKMIKEIRNKFIVISKFNEAKLNIYDFNKNIGYGLN